MKLLQDVRRALRVFSRPLRRRSSRTDVVIRPYRGFGSRTEICLFGRVFRKSSISPQADREDVMFQLATIWRRIWRRGLRDAEVEAIFAGGRHTVRTDRFGFFFFRFATRHPPEGAGLWHQATLLLHEEATGFVTDKAIADIYITPESARYAVVSDIDDTVVYTGVVNKMKMMWHLFFTRAQSRVAFPGVGAFYRALYLGKTGDQHNPMLYVSRGPWSIYEVLETFFNLHSIPIGPVLLLRYWGMTFDHPLPRRARDHKWDAITSIMEVYKDLPLILIGDSGQKDPEIYARIVRENPGRVLAVYIRDVGSKPDRLQAIAQLAEETARTGTVLLMADDSQAMAEDAIRQGFVGDEAMAEVLAACSEKN